MIDPTKRFSKRVENYVKYRPSYPQKVIALLQAECNLHAGSVVADVGSGTGLLSKLLLEAGCWVFGVEPNREMREAGERLLKDNPLFTSIDATAEATTLQDHSVDFVTAGQAFHWFNQEMAKAEFLRILKPDGWVMLAWNTRRTSSSPFLDAYERMLKSYSTDYGEVDHRRISSDDIGAFFGPLGHNQKTFEYKQLFDFESLKGRLLSSSYAPDQDHPNYPPMIAELREIFDAHQVNGKVSFDYDTKVYYGRLSG